MTKTPLIGAVVVTHGTLGDDLVSAAREIVKDVTHMRAVSIGWDNDVEKGKTLIARALREVDQGAGAVILTDMFGGTPSNLAITFLKKGSVEVISGVNLPMVIKAANQAGQDLDQLAVVIRDQGKRQITIAGELLGE